VAPITAYHHLSLSVTDLDRSVRWYTGVLGFVVTDELEGAGFRRARLRHPDAAGLIMTLTCHADAWGEPFDERRTGLDHLAFRLPTVEDVAALGRRLAAVGAERSEVTVNDSGARLAFRDPDRIQLEVFAEGP
jgi:glyoxylase I family protein